MKGYIHSYQSMGTLDGPGLRFLVFMQGCPLRCGYCHNPDTWDPKGSKITATPSQVLKKIERYQDYFGDTGGVTVSGGEALLQAEFASELFCLCKEKGIHTCLDTSGCIWNTPTEKLLEYTDLVLLDIKMCSDELYQKHIGMPLSQVLFFLDQLEKRKIPAWIRQVSVPGLNDSEEDKIRLLALTSNYRCIERVELLPFRKLCTEKYEQMHLPFPFSCYKESAWDTPKVLK